MEFKTNQKVRDFLILEKIGSGGMGSVFLAKDEMLDRLVAIKVLEPMVAKNPNITERFRQEAKVQAGLVHPNIVALHSLFIEEGQYCMVMEYSKGKTLKDLIKSEKGVPKNQIIGIFKQILAAVGYAHSKGIIHRDIKPANIMVDEGWNIKVMDFGIAKIIGDRNLTETGSKIGTIFYMSPEQITASRDIDHRSDLYSLGVTLYEMLTGGLPYENDTSEFMIMREIIENDFPDPRVYDTDIPEGLVTILHKMLKKNPDERYSNCSEILRDIKSVTTAVKDNNSGKSAEGLKFIEMEAFQKKKKVTEESPTEIIVERSGAGAPVAGQGERFFLLFKTVVFFLLPLGLVELLLQAVGYEHWFEFYSSIGGEVYLLLIRSLEGFLFGFALYVVLSHTKTSAMLITAGLIAGLLQGGIEAFLYYRQLIWTISFLGSYTAIPFTLIFPVLLSASFYMVLRKSIYAAYLFIPVFAAGWVLSAIGSELLLGMLDEFSFKVFLNAILMNEMVGIVLFIYFLAARKIRYQ